MSIMNSMLCSFMEAVTPGQRRSWQEGLGSHLHTHQPAKGQTSGPSHSRSSSKDQRVPIDPNVSQRRSIILAGEGQSESGSEEEFQDSRDRLVPENQVEPTPTPQLLLNPLEVVSAPPTMTSASMGGPVPSREVDTNQEVIGHEDLIEDAKFYQDAAFNYQNAYEVLLAQQAELQDKFKAQSSLMEEASAAIHAAEMEVK